MLGKAKNEIFNALRDNGFPAILIDPFFVRMQGNIKTGSKDDFIHE
jgi:hypothetical protein